MVAIEGTPSGGLSVRQTNSPALQDIEMKLGRIRSKSSDERKRDTKPPRTSRLNFSKPTKQAVAKLDGRRKNLVELSVLLFEARQNPEGGTIQEISERLMSLRQDKIKKHAGAKESNGNIRSDRREQDKRLSNLVQLAGDLRKYSEEALTRDNRESSSSLDMSTTTEADTPSVTLSESNTKLNQGSVQRSTDASDKAAGDKISEEALCEAADVGEPEGEEEDEPTSSDSEEKCKIQLQVCIDNESREDLNRRKEHTPSSALRTSQIAETLKNNSIPKRRESGGGKDFDNVADLNKLGDQQEQTNELASESISSFALSRTIGNPSETKRMALEPPSSGDRSKEGSIQFWSIEQAILAFAAKDSESNLDPEGVYSTFSDLVKQSIANELSCKTNSVENETSYDTDTVSETNHSDSSGTESTESSSTSIDEVTNTFHRIDPPEELPTIFEETDMDPLPEDPPSVHDNSSTHKGEMVFQQETEVYKEEETPTKVQSLRGNEQQDPRKTANVDSEEMSVNSKGEATTKEETKSLVEDVKDAQQNPVEASNEKDHYNPTTNTKAVGTLVITQTDGDSCSSSLSSNTGGKLWIPGLGRLPLHSQKGQDGDTEFQDMLIKALEQTLVELKAKRAKMATSKGSTSNENQVSVPEEVIMAPKLDCSGNGNVASKDPQPKQDENSITCAKNPRISDAKQKVVQEAPLSPEEVMARKPPETKSQKQASKSNLVGTAREDITLSSKESFDLDLQHRRALLETSGGKGPQAPAVNVKDKRRPIQRTPKSADKRIGHPAGEYIPVEPIFQDSQNALRAKSALEKDLAAKRTAKKPSRSKTHRHRAGGSTSSSPDEVPSWRELLVTRSSSRGSLGSSRSTTLPTKQR